MNTHSCFIPLPHLRVLFASDKLYNDLKEKYKRLGTNSDLFAVLRGALSIENELMVLRTLALISRVRLAAYKDDYQTNVKTLRGDNLEMFSNERNAVVLVRIFTIIAYHIILYHIISYHIISYHIILYYIIPNNH